MTITFLKNISTETEPTIFLCKRCGDIIERATKYQIRQDFCPNCFKHKHQPPQDLFSSFFNNLSKLDK